MPTYDVFDEDRYFEPAKRVQPFEVQGKKIGVTICEDIWTDEYLPRPLYDVEPVRALVEQGAEIILNLSASPFVWEPGVRLEMIAALAQTHKRSICYCNAVGGNDQLIFDGNSFAVNANGDLSRSWPDFVKTRRSLIPIHRRDQFTEPRANSNFSPRFQSGVAITGQMRFQFGRAGLSGGIDSAVSRGHRRRCPWREERHRRLDAEPVFFPRQRRRRARLAKNLGIKCVEIPIGNAFTVFKAQFEEIFKAFRRTTRKKTCRPVYAA